MKAPAAAEKRRNSPREVGWWLHAAKGQLSYRRCRRFLLNMFGLNLRLASVDGGDVLESKIPTTSPLCRLVSRHPILAAQCVRARKLLAERVATALHTQCCRCPAGLTEIGVPIMVGGQHVATLFAVRVRGHGWTGRDFCRLERLLARDVTGRVIERIRKACAFTRRVDSGRICFGKDVLELVAEHLAGLMVSSPVPLGNQDRLLIGRMRRIIASDLADLSHVGDVAKRMGCSADHLERVFKAQTGETLSQHLRLARVEAAKALLLNRASTMAAVAFEVGFGSISQFNRTFKRVAGCAPKSWRSAARPLFASAGDTATDH
jgi:AraC-like DNA-binding protein